MELHEAIRRRRMVRSFTGEPLPPGVLDAVFDAAARAPSAGFTQAVELVVLEGPDETARYWDASFPDPAGRDRFRWPGLFEAPALIVVLVRPDAYVERYSEPDKARTGLGDGTDAWSVPYWWVDAGMAAMNALLTATAQDIGALFFGLFHREQAVLEALGVPPGWRAAGTIAVGRRAPGEEPGRSSATRRRRPAGDIVHRGRW